MTGEGSLAWEVARASGLTSYVLLLGLVAAGLLLAHPWSARLRRGDPTTWLRAHVSLATFTLVFTVLHVVVVASDEWAQVGWQGALLPFASRYRPVPVTLGVLAVWAGLITGLTAALAGRVAGRVWWPVHRGAVAIFVLVWAHSVLAGTDSAALRGFYLLTGAALAVLATSRYLARSPRDRLDELAPRLRPSSDRGRADAGTDGAAPPAGQGALR